MKQTLLFTPHLHLFQSEVTDLIVSADRIGGVRTRTGIDFHAQAVVICTGTFLNGKIHVGLQNYSGGRAGEPAANSLSQMLMRYGLMLGRLKTGTVPRLDARSIDWSVLSVQDGTDPYGKFSFSSVENQLPQVDCHITYTNEQTHDIIRANLDRSPMYSGEIRGVGPRYCPSIEDKIVRFADKTRHQIFLEPEGLNTVEVYPNGISTSLPYDVQVKLVRSIKGLEKAEIIRPGYAVEYDFVFPTQLKATLETKAIAGLYLAGQINGTSGYEEAACQGFVAGVNAALKVRRLEPFTLERSQAYIGVLIDDLVTKGTEEPYRMLTSRAEYRLLLREDNADLRLRNLGHQIGLIDDITFAEHRGKVALLEEAEAYFHQHRLHPTEHFNGYLERLGLEPIRQSITYAEFLRRPQVSIELLLPLDAAIAELPIGVLDQVEIKIKYEGYVRRQQEQIDRASRLEHVDIPVDLDFGRIIGLSNEVREKLMRVRPQSLGQASRIPGVTPASISLLTVALKRHRAAS